MLVALLIALVLLAGCSGSSRKTAPTTSPTVIASTTTTASGSPTTVTTAPASSTPPPAGDRCTTSSSQIVKLEGRAATGHLLSVYEVTNTAGRPCRVVGYPAVSLLDAGGRTLTQAQRGPGFILPDRAPAVVSLAPGQAGFFGIESTTVCPGNEPGTPSEQVQVTLPDDSVPVAVSDEIVVCSPPNILVSPIRATPEDITRR